MTEINELLKTLRELGILQMLIIPIALFLFTYLFKKFIINGSGSFIKTSITSYIDVERDRVKQQETFNNQLSTIREELKETAEALWESRRYYDMSIKTIQDDITELLTYHRKKSEPVKESTSP